MTYLNDEEICAGHERHDSFNLACAAYRRRAYLYKLGGRWPQVPPLVIFRCPTWRDKGLHWHLGRKSKKAQERLDAERIR